MTGYTVHTGSTKKFSASWDRIFSGSPTGKKTGEQAESKKAPAKVAKKSAARKAPASDMSLPVKKSALKKAAVKKAAPRNSKRGS
ncbi:hypothetical protein [Schlesneria sp. T3-172]|uniref:hypothetical protein n=1 Tax=Schlesneria TaxID=656899 RepID=UPI002EE30A66